MIIDEKTLDKIKEANEYLEEKGYKILVIGDGKSKDYLLRKLLDNGLPVTSTASLDDVITFKYQSIGGDPNLPKGRERGHKKDIVSYSSKKYLKH